MYLSKITLYTSGLAPSRLLQLVNRGEYVMHQWLWDLFPGQQQRQFLYRREELHGAFRFFVLSHQAPAQNDIFAVETRAFTPDLASGQQLRFSLRANPTVCKAEKRHDLLMETKYRLRDKVEASEIWSHQQQAAQAWLARQGEQSGFELEQVIVDAYCQQIIRKEKSRVIQFSSVDYCGVLTVTEPARFLRQLALGYGKSRAFGCGLMLIRPERLV